MNDSLVAPCVNRTNLINNWFTHVDYLEHKKADPT
jgi:hypothetical protein